MRVLSIALAVLVFCACISTTFAQKAPLTDDEITDQVRLRLASHPDVKGGAIDVDVKGGVVTLKGKVRTEKGKSKATGVAHKVKGVKQVINELVVTPT